MAKSENIKGKLARSMNLLISPLEAGAKVASRVRQRRTFIGKGKTKRQKM